LERIHEQPQGFAALGAQGEQVEASRQPQKGEAVWADCAQEIARRKLDE
jgi:hypothetical protein